LSAHLAEWRDIGAASDVRSDEPRAVVVTGKPIALFRLGADIFALHDRCPHGQASLSDGFIDGDNVECPLHQGLVCIRTGAPKSEPITEPTATFPTRVIAGRLEILV